MKIFILIPVFLILIIPFSLFSIESNTYDFLLNKKVKYLIVNHQNVDLQNIKVEEIQNKWSDFTDFDWDFNKKGSTLLFGVILPDSLIETPAIYFNSYLPDFEVWMDGKKIYNYIHYLKPDYNGIIISLENDYRGKVFIIKVPINQRIIKGNIFKFKFGNHQTLDDSSLDFIDESYETQIFQVCIISIILFTSILSLLFFLYRWKYKDYPFLFYSLATIAATTENFNPRLLHMMVDITPFVFSIIELFARFSELLFLILFIRHTFKLLNKRLMNILWRIILVYSLISIGLFFWEPIPKLFFSISLMYSPLGLIAIAICIVLIIKSEVYKQLKPKFFFQLFMIIFLLVISYTLISIIKLDYHREAPLLWGILSMSFAMMSLLISHYMDSIRKNINYQVEIEVNKNELLRLQQANTEAQFETLKNQINPHFLFNSLNALSSLCYPNPQPIKAKQFIDEFSRIFRYILEVKNKNLVELRDELAFMKSYLFLQEIRFGDALIVKIEIEESYLDLLVPALSLQILVENAIKHNIVSKEKPLVIEIFIEINILIIRNNLQKRNFSEIASTKTGQANIAGRYLLITDLKPVFEEAENQYIVKLPLLKDE